MLEHIQLMQDGAIYWSERVVDENTGESISINRRCVLHGDDLTSAPDAIRELAAQNWN